MSLPTLKIFDGLLKLSISALLSLIAGMINTYHNQSVVDRKQLLDTVHLSTVVNARQDEQIKDIGEILRELKNELNQPIRRGNS
jgi:iron-sulfur cluster repair protein YtfE (RIC family)